MSNTNRQRLDLETKVGFLGGLQPLKNNSLEKHDEFVAVIRSQNDVPEGIQDERLRISLIFAGAKQAILEPTHS